MLNFKEFVGESIKPEKFEEFSTHRLDGASTIAKNAHEKGGDALLTYYHFKVKLPYYKKASHGKFDVEKAKDELKDLVEKLSLAVKNDVDIEQRSFQELVGKIEVLGELLIKQN